VTAAFDRAALLATFDEVFADMRNTDVRPVPHFEDIAKPDRRVHRILYLPIEVKAREFVSKSLIAREAIAQNFNVIMGASWVLNAWAPYLPSGVVLFKSTNSIDARSMGQWVQSGHMTGVLDEEVFGIDCTPDFLKATMHPHAAAYADLVCAQGQSYADVFPFPANVRVTGNPRTLTYKPPQGDDILVCLQSGNINHAAIKEYGFAHVVRAVLTLSAGPMNSPLGQAWANIFRQSIEYECDALPLVRDTIEALGAAFPDRTIRVRPHPIENADTWAFGRSNIVLETAGGITDVLGKSSVAVFVSGCTTGLDALLAGVPAVRLGRGGHGISARMHTEVNSADDAVEAVRRAEKWDGSIKSHFAPVDVMTPLRELYKQHQADSEIKFSHNVSYTPQVHQLQKFPETPLEEVARFVGSPAEQVAWNTWFF